MPQTRPTHLLLFEIAGQRLGLPAATLVEIARAVQPAPLPRAPDVIEGVIDVRGRLVPVYDVRRRFGLPPQPLRVEDHLVVAWAGPRLVAVRCDHATDLRELDVVRPDDPALRDRADLAGVARQADGLVVIWDLAAFLSEAEAAALDAALDAVAAEAAAGPSQGPSPAGEAP